MLQEGLLSRGSCGIDLRGSGSLCLLKHGLDLLNDGIRDGWPFFQGKLFGHSVKEWTQAGFISLNHDISIMSWRGTEASS